MKMKSKDIARILGISPATVSLALNNKPGISEETRKRIFDLIKENGGQIPSSALGSRDFGRQGEAGENHPLEMDRKLLSGADVLNRHLQFVIYKKHGHVVSDTPFFSTLIEAVTREAGNYGYTLTITYVDEQKDSVASAAEQIVRTAPAGILLLATEMKAQDVDAFKGCGVPLLLLDSQFDTQDIDTVCIDNRDGVYKAVDYLASLGYGEIGYLHSNVWINNFEQRLHHFRSCCRDRGLNLSEDHLFSLESSAEGAYRDMVRILSQNPSLPPALLADNDLIACGAIRALKEYGFRIPEDVAIVGFDDLPLCEIMDPPLTTVRVFNQGMGRAAVRRLLYIIGHPQEEIQKTYIGTKLVVRKSC